MQNTCCFIEESFEVSTACNLNIEKGMDVAFILCPYSVTPIYSDSPNGNCTAFYVSNLTADPGVTPLVSLGTDCKLPDFEHTATYDTESCETENENTFEEIKINDNQSIDVYCNFLNLFSRKVAILYHRKQNLGSTGWMITGLDGNLTVTTKNTTTATNYHSLSITGDSSNPVPFSAGSFAATQTLINSLAA